MAIYTKALSTNTRTWSDLDLDFTKHPVTKDVSIKRNVEAIKRSVRNLIMTNPFERPFHPEIGSGITGLLFDLVSPTTANVLQSEIRQVINNFEPRARVETVECYPVPDTNTYDVRIYFYVENLPAELIEFQTILEAVR